LSTFPVKPFKYDFSSVVSKAIDSFIIAVSESFFHKIKTELIYSERYTTREIAKQSIFQYIEVYYNRVRRHSTIGSVAPMIFENQYKMVA
jgi:putative transposase